MSRIYNGNRFYLVDDCDTLIVKLENAIREEESKPDYDIDLLDRLDKYLDDLQRVMREGDYVTMERILNEHSYMFKRYR